ncbi:putative RNA-binding Zn ribbon-like protein [Prauserella shujinwangii]|uniref:Putative RNA-binding Zn ribbon-like protein n=1 Tax=Prauserella shujinwangii TaxID=1453103 RepID=A0A2T0LVJ8_9PSEU|nr:CGNR zinc finger domain-containing protein [Prauserella shujinwangii]PRX47827.1 putative RNA-binding Zn ribbon-like protein [Prauserella shujinwangii]
MLVLPGEPLPVRLMNTRWADRHGVHDVLATEDGLRDWLVATGQAEGGPTPGGEDLDRFRALRDALRSLAALSTGDTRPAATMAAADIDGAVAEVNAAVARAVTWPRLIHRAGALDRSTGCSGGPAERALSGIAREAVDLLTDPERRLRACYAPGCVLYFVKDHPRREWCSTACGNRARVARHYERHRKRSADEQ